MKTALFLQKSLAILVIMVNGYLQAQNSTGGPPPASGVVSFQKTFGSGYAYDIIKDSLTGDIYVAGSRGGISLAKFDSNGVKIWFRQYGISGSVRSFKKTTSGFFLTGTTYSIPNTITAGFAVKVDTGGHIIVGKTFTNDHTGGNDDLNLLSMEVIGNYCYFMGVTGGFSCASLGTIIIKTDFNFNIIWSNIYGNWTGAESIKKTIDNRLIISGYVDNLVTAGRDLFLLKIDTNGNVIWSKFYGSNTTTSSEGYEVGHSLKITLNNDIIVAGETYQGFSIQGTGIFTLKVNQDGGVVWSKDITNYYYAIGFGLDVSFNGNISIAGTVADSGLLESRFCLVNLDSNGTLLWSKSVNNLNVGNSYFYSVTKLDDGNYLTAGDSDDHFYLSKFNLNHNLNCNDTNAGMVAIPVQAITGTMNMTKTLVNPIVVNFNFVESNAVLTLVDICIIDTATSHVDTTHVDTTFVKEISKDQVLVYPNPAQNYINIVGADKKVLSIYNSLGELVLQKTIIDQNDKINFNFVPGLYFYNIGQSKDKMSKLLIIKY